RARVDLQISTVGKALALDKQAVKITVTDAEGVLFTSSVDKGRLAQHGRSYTLRKATNGLKKLVVTRKKNRAISVAFATGRWELPTRLGDELSSPFTVRVDLGVHSGALILKCTTAKGGNAQCPAS